MKILGTALLVGLAGSAILLSGTSAGAIPTKAAPAARPASVNGPMTLPAGYIVVTSAPFTAPNGVQSHGSITCPGAKQPSGGGAYVQSSSLYANINSSYPYGQSWEIDVNNTSGADTYFTVYAVCLSHSASYTVATSAGTTGQGVRDQQTYCPAHTVVIGGGVLSETVSTAVNMNATTPFSVPNGETGWEVWMTSAQTAPTNDVVYAICHSKPKGWSIQTGPSSANAPGTETGASVACPGASVAIGGGGYTYYNVSSTTIDMNTSYTYAGGWTVYENNSGTLNNTISATAVCAGT